MQEDQGGLILIDAAKPKALGDAADGHGPHGRDTSRNNATVQILELFSVNAASAAHEYG